jgi:putative ABC transport system permease protein
MRGALDGVRIALRAIARSPLRASLTVLGILIGVAAVVTVTALGAGARADVSSKVESLGSNFILVFPQASQASGARGAQGAGVHLTDDDARAVLRESTSVATVAPMLRALVQVVVGDHNEQSYAVGTTLSYFPVRDWALRRGTFWDTRDELLKSKVVVLGATVAEKLFGAEDPVGRTVRIGRYPYRVLGVLDAKGDGPFGDDQDDCIVMPIASFRSRVLRTPPGFAGVLLASATSPDTTERAVTQIDAVLRQRHRIAEGRDPDFVVRTQKELAQFGDTIYGLLSLLLVVVAGVSLFVGGIGVMNIMLVSVTERTREIGIRMAIGAREADIRAQFLVEAVVLALLGGLAGTAIGIATIVALHAVLHMTLPLQPAALEISVAVSGLTGVVFGFFPALRAARLDPIEALRHE